MLPGVVSSPIVLGDLPQTPEQEITPVPVELVYSQPINAEDSGNLHIDIGPDFEGRFFVVTWMTTRSVVTGSPLNINFQVNGQNYGFFSEEQKAFGYLYHAYVFAPGETMTIRYSNNSTVIRRLVIWKIGSPGNPGCLVESTFNGSNTSPAVTVPLRTSELTPDTQIMAITGGRPQSSGPTFVEPWLSSDVTQLFFHRDSNALTDFSRGVVPADASVITLPAGVTLKDGHIHQVRKQSSPKITFTPNYVNKKYHFLAEKGCFQDAGRSAPCQDGDRVMLWENYGNSVNAQQSERARRPVFRTGGLNGYPYIECLRSREQYFEDLLDLPQASGLTGWTPLTIHIVADFYDFAQMNPIISDGGNVYKSDLHIQTNGFVRLYKGAGTVVNIAPNTPVVLTARVVNNITYNFMLNGVFFNVGQGGNSPSGGQTVTQFLRSTGTLGPGYFHGRLYEIIINHDNPAQGRGTFEPLHRSLMQKYGFTLPS